MDHAVARESGGTRTPQIWGAAATLFALALLAITAPACFANSFTSPVSTTHLDLSQKTINVFKSTAGEVTCTTLTGTAHLTSKEFTAIETSELKFEGCHIIFFGSTVSATVKANGCNYKLYAAETTDIVCPVGKEIEVTAAGCNIKIGAQTGLKTLGYENDGSHIDATLSLSGIKSTHSGFNCGTGSDSAGTLKGQITVEGRESSAEGKVVDLEYVP